MTVYTITLENGYKIRSTITKCVRVDSEIIDSEILMVNGRNISGQSLLNYGFAREEDGIIRILDRSGGPWMFQAKSDWCGYIRDPHPGEQILEFYGFIEKTNPEASWTDNAKKKKPMNIRIVYDGLFHVYANGSELRITVTEN